MCGWVRTEPILLINAGCRPGSFQCISSICWAHFSDVTVSLGFRKLQWIRLAADHQTVTVTSFWYKFGFWKCFGAASRSSHWAGHHWLLYKIHFLSHITIWLRNGILLLCILREDNTSKWWYFFGQLLRHPLTKFFHLSNLLQMPNNCRMADIEFFSSFLWSRKRISFSDRSQLVVVNFWWPATTLLIFKALVSLAKLLEPPR